MNNYSKELQDWTRNNFASQFGYSFMKSVTYDFSTIGYDRSLYIDEEAEQLIPESEKSKDIVLFKFKKSRGCFSGKSLPVEGIEYYKSFNSIDEMIDDDWVVD